VNELVWGRVFDPSGWPGFRAAGFSFAPLGLAQSWATILRSFGASVLATAAWVFVLAGTSFTLTGGLRVVASAAAAWGFGGGALRPGTSGPPGQPGAAVPTFVGLTGVGVPVFGGRTNASAATGVGAGAATAALGFCDAACFCWA
jgi:hypothetical protein